MFPCSLCRLSVISLPLPCFLASGSTFQHIKLDWEQKILSVSWKKATLDSPEKNVKVRCLKWKRCPQLHLHKDVLMLAGLSHCAPRSLFSSFWKTHTGGKSANPSDSVLIAKNQTNQNPHRWVSPRNQFEPQHKKTEKQTEELEKHPHSINAAQRPT